MGDLWAREISLDGPKGIGEEWKYKAPCFKTGGKAKEYIGRNTYMEFVHRYLYILVKLSIAVTGSTVGEESEDSRKPEVEGNDSYQM